MDRIHLPIRFEGLSERDLHVHLRHCAAVCSKNEYVELLLTEAGVSVPLIKRVWATKPPALDLSLRSGSIGREALVGLRARFEADGYDLTVRFTPKRRLLGRVVVSLSVDDPLFPAKGVAVLAAVASQVGSPWPQQVFAGYGARTNTVGLPGDLVIDDPALQSAWEMGKAIGTGIARVLGRL